MLTVLTLFSAAWALIENVIFIYKNRTLLSEYRISGWKIKMYSMLSIALSAICVASIFRNHYVELTKHVAVASLVVGSMLLYISHQLKVILETSGTDRTHRALDQSRRIIFISFAGTTFSTILLLTGDF